MTTLSISVIIPVYNGAATLELVLRRLRESSRQAGEVIVVDDGSTDGSAAIAAACEATVLATPGRCGPATARVLGAREAKGDVLLFLDADVYVHPGSPGNPGTLERIERVLVEQTAVDAVFGSYDTAPSAPNFVSQWKNLSHHFVHQNGNPVAQTFWAGCGAIRKNVFETVGGFDLSYRGATIEDIELGYRLRQRGFRILLDRSILCTHAKKWSAWSAWKTDLLYRGIPWTRLILRTRIVPDDLNVSITQRLSMVFAWLMVAAFGLAAVNLPGASIAGMVLFVLLIMHSWWMEPPTAGRRVLRWLAPLAVTGAALWVAVSLSLPLFAGCLLLSLGLAAIFRRHPANVRSRGEDLCYALYFGCALTALVIDLPPEGEILAAATLALLLLGLNQTYYAFLARTRGVAFLMAALPFQLLYHLTNGISLAAGIALTVRESPARLWRRPIRPLPHKEIPLSQKDG